LYYWIEKNKIKYNFVLSAISILILLLAKSSFLQGIATGFLFVAIPYLTFDLYQKNKKQRDQ
jgi:hypothetical protein